MAREMVVNEAEITVSKAKRNHPGFVDAENNELHPGDIIAVSTYGGVMRSAVITRFTPRRVYFMWQYLPAYYVDKSRDKCEFEDCVQLPYHEMNITGAAYADRRMPKILKISEV